MLQPTLSTGMAPYQAAVLALLTISAANAQTFTTLQSFNGANGSAPNSLVQGPNGNFYGTTNSGGANNSCNNSCGTVFEISPAGALTTLHNFDFTGGCYPSGALTLASDGNFYGVTLMGGPNSCSGFGTLFKITPSGTLTTIRVFDFTDGASLAPGPSRPLTVPSTERLLEAGRAI
jgi:uncharacterized repeat protein (TIGR03803 family)